MSTKYKGLTVTFEHDVSEEYMERITSAIEIMHGVADVTSAEATVNDHMNREMIRRELINKLYKTLEK